MSGRIAKTPFILAPGAAEEPERKGKLGERTRLAGSNSPKITPNHTRKASEVVGPKIQITGKKPTQQKSTKASPRSTSPKSPFSDLSQMLKALSRKAEKKTVHSPYRVAKDKASGSPKSGTSPKARPSVTAASPRPSFAFQSKVKMELAEGRIKSPRIYENQIFRDVYDPSGGHDKELYSSFADSSLEVYQEAANGKGVMMLKPQESGAGPAFKGKHEGTELPIQAARNPDSSLSEVPVPGSLFSSELFQKLSKLQENHSESETASEEARDRAAKQG